MTRCLEALADVSLVAGDRPAGQAQLEDLLQRHPLTPYLGQTLYGVVEDTWVRGHHVLHDGVPSEAPCGSILLRKDHE